MHLSRRRVGSLGRGSRLTVQRRRRGEAFDASSGGFRESVADERTGWGSASTANKQGTLRVRAQCLPERVLAAVQAHLRVQFLGVDMVVARDGRVLVVDVNHFSGAPRTVPGFLDAAADAVRNRRRSE